MLVPRRLPVGRRLMRSSASRSKLAWRFVPVIRIVLKTDLFLSVHVSAVSRALVPITIIVIGTGLSSRFGPTDLEPANCGPRLWLR